MPRLKIMMKKKKIIKMMMNLNFMILRKKASTLKKASFHPLFLLLAKEDFLLSLIFLFPYCQ